MHFYNTLFNNIYIIQKDGDNLEYDDGESEGKGTVRGTVGSR